MVGLGLIGGCGGGGIAFLGLLVYFWWSFCVCRFWNVAVWGCRSAARVLGLILAVYVCYVRVVCSVVLGLVGFWCFGRYAANAGFGMLLIGFSGLLGLFVWGWFCFGSCDLLCLGWLVCYFLWVGIICVLCMC